MLLQFFIQLVLPIAFIILLFRSRYSSKTEWLINVIPLGLAVAFVFVTARWDMFSYYLRWVTLFVFLYALYKAYEQIEPTGHEKTDVFKWGNIIPNLIVTVFLGWLTISSLLGYMTPKGAVRLAYPLQGRVFYVGGGGNSIWINGHQRAYPQQYAVDILALNAFGNPGKVFGSGELGEHVIFGEAIFSPCNGTVKSAVDQFPDQAVGARDEINLAGNYVVLHCEGVDVLLAHMQMNSIMVKAGDTVTIGQMLGRVGNSGNSTQPHLHIHATTGSLQPDLLDGEPVPILFERSFLVRNQLFNGN